MSRAVIYFVIALVMEAAILLSGSKLLAIVFLFPGMIFSAVVSHGMDTGNASFIGGLVLDAALYSYVAVLTEKTLKRRKTAV